MAKHSMALTLPIILMTIAALLQRQAASEIVSSFGSQLPDGLSQAGKLKAFLVCRKECIAKCDRLVYVYSAKKEFCHDCLKQCIASVVQQARSLRIDFNAVTDEDTTRKVTAMDRPPIPDDGGGAGDGNDGPGGGGGGRRRRQRRRRDRERRRQNRKRRRGANRDSKLGGGDGGGGGGGDKTTKMG